MVLKTHSNNSSNTDRQVHGPIRLMREVRFSIDRDWAAAAHGEDGFEAAHPINNSWGGWPSAVGIAPYLVLRIVVWGLPDAVTGYLVNIQALDRLLRRRAIPLAAKRLRTCGVGLTGESLLRGIWQEVSRELPPRCRVETLQLWTTPYLSHTIRSEEDLTMELTQCFEFSASHRLHVASMTDEENRRYFGKCNNPHGHGHNYRIEVTVAREVDDENGTVLPLPAFESVVNREVIDRLDHKHLNADVPQFAELNPSVENIARTIWSFLDGKLSPAELRRVRVWETAKTYAEYSGAQA